MNKAVSTWYRSIVWAGLLSGVLDLTAALVTNGLRGAKPIRILQSIASGLLGAKSFQGGMKSATLGVLLHFVIAFGAAIVYYLLSRKLRFLITQPIISGLLYGTAVYFFMNRVVVPLSAAPFRISFQWVSGLLVHLLCVGLPIALVIRHFETRR